MTTWVQEAGDDCLVTVWVVPGASRSQIVGVHGDALKVRVAAPPEGGKANTAATKMLQAASGHRARLTSGTASRRKVIRLEGCSVEHAKRSLIG